jgi:hypothetical protein
MWFCTIRVWELSNTWMLTAGAKDADKRCINLTKIVPFIVCDQIVMILVGVTRTRFFFASSHSTSAKIEEVGCQHLPIR